MMKFRNDKNKINALLIVAMLGILVACIVPPIPQDITYHQFADQRIFFGIPNFWNVVSNVPFLLIGLFALAKRKSLHCSQLLLNFYLVFFAGVLLVGFGSAYYHLQPDNETLVWDRLPMTFAFMAFVPFVISDYVYEPAGRLLLLPLLGIGVFSVFYWQYTEQAGYGDLRLYALVQFLPMLLIPLIMLMFQPRYCNNTLLWLMLGCYLLAKFFEFFDVEIYRLLGFISGHTIKHLIAALGPLLFFFALRKAP